MNPQAAPQSVTPVDAQKIHRWLFVKSLWKGLPYVGSVLNWIEGSINLAQSGRDLLAGRFAEAQFNLQNGLMRMARASFFWSNSVPPGVSIVQGSSYSIMGEVLSSDLERRFVEEKAIRARGLSSDADPHGFFDQRSVARSLL